MRSRLGPWSATLLGAVITTAVLLGAAIALGGQPQLLSVAVAVGLFVVVGVFSLPVLAAMGIAPGVAFMVAMSTYVLQVLLGALLLRAGGPGGALEDVLDQRWLGAAVVSLALVITVGVVSDQLRSARRRGVQEAATRAEGDVTFHALEPKRR